MMKILKRVIWKVSMISCRSVKQNFMDHQVLYNSKSKRKEKEKEKGKRKGKGKRKRKRKIVDAIANNIKNKQYAMLIGNINR